MTYKFYATDLDKEDTSETNLTASAWVFVLAWGWLRSIFFWGRSLPSRRLV